MGRLTASWGTHALAPPSMRAGMALVALPLGVAASAEAFLVVCEAGGREADASARPSETDQQSAQRGALSQTSPSGKRQDTQLGSEAWIGSASSADAKLIQAGPTVMCQFV